MSDEKPRPYVKVSRVKIGSVLFPVGFSCMEDARIKTVYCTEKRLFVMCDNGKHFLDEEDGAYVGFRLG